MAGDEAALDAFTWRKSGKNMSNTGSSDYSFFFGVVDGKVKKELPQKELTDK